MDRRLTTVVEFVDKNLHTKLTPQKAARMACLSYSQFAALFRKETGKRFSQYVREKRIARAKSLLNDPSQEIKEVCFSVGYASLSRFYHDFKKVAGRPPAKFRKNKARKPENKIKKSE